MEQAALTPLGDFIEGSEILSDPAVIPPEEWAQIRYSASRIDGAGDLIIFSRIYRPISVPGLAAVSLFEIVGRWNQFTAPLLYLTDETKYTVQFALQRVVASNESVSGTDVVLPNTRMAAVVIGVSVLVLVFPFVQRFFVKGIVLGATKE